MGGHTQGDCMDSILNYRCGWQFRADDLKGLCGPPKGASIKYVHTEGGGGVWPKVDIVLKLSKGGCVKLRTRGEGGQKTRKSCGRT